MVGIYFQRPLGSYADTKELEYISALHQSGQTVRPDGSIRAVDIKNFLSSRHGVRVTEEVVMRSIVEELGGSLPTPDLTEKEDWDGDVEKGQGDEEETDDDDDEEEEEEEEDPQPVLDICQLTAMLFIPFFRKGNVDEDVLTNSQTKLDSSNKEQQEEAFGHHQAVVGHVLDVALGNILAELKSYTHGDTEEENHGVVMTTSVLRQALEAFGEYEVPESLLVEMIEQAQIDRNDLNQKEVFFNKSAFLHALTGDTLLYDPAKIDYTASTHFDDARKAKEYQQLALYGKKTELVGRRPSLQPQIRDADGNSQALPFETIYMASNIDNTADTYRSATWFTLVWFETVLVYFGYMFGTGLQTAQLVDGWCHQEFGCSILKSLIGWTVVFLQLMAMGFTWIFMASLGNTTHPTETCNAKISMTVRLLVGMGVVTFVTIVSFFKESQTQVWDTVKDEFRGPAYLAAFLGGLVIIFYQLIRLAGMYFPLGRLQAGGMEKKEKATKAAASYKVLGMVEHAMLLHGDPSAIYSVQSMKESTVSEIVRELATSFHTSSTRKKTEGRRDKKAMNARGTTNKALLNFHKMQDAKEETGGIFWFFKKMWNGTLFEQEGVFLHGRLWAVNLVQFFICALMITTFIVSLQFLDEFVGTKEDPCTIKIGEDGLSFPNYDPDWNTTSDGFENLFNINETHWLNPFYFSEDEGQFPKFNGTAFLLPDGAKSPTLCIDTYIINATEPYVYDNAAATQNEFVEMLGVKEYEWKGALAAGLIAAFAGVLSIALVYMPSFVSSVLKLRSGVEPSLKGDYSQFGVYRKSPDHTASLFGTNFWGCFYTALCSFFLIAVVTFVCLFSGTREYVKAVIAIFIGMGTTIFIQTMVMNCLRGSFYSGFYRKKPAGANIMNVILECWSLAKSAGVVTVRFAKLLVVSAIYIGRIDTPMLAPGVGYIGPMQLDKAPNAFRIDLLSHEAHRHPYIERLGLLYLLKLYNGKDFGTRAGAYWRMLLVLALMPWMRNYRLRPSRSMLHDDNIDEDDIVSVRRQVINEMGDDHSTRGEDRFGMQFEMDLTRRAYDKISKRNRDLKAALLLARDKVRELKQEKKNLKIQLGRSSSKKGSVSRSSSKKSGASLITEVDELLHG